MSRCRSADYFVVVTCPHCGAIIRVIPLSGPKPSSVKELGDNVIAHIKLSLLNHYFYVHPAEDLPEIEKAVDIVDKDEEVVRLCEEMEGSSSWRRLSGYVGRTVEQPE
jgi:hypothetical protein